MKNITETQKCYLQETRYLIDQLENNPKSFNSILRYLSMTKDNSLMLGFKPAYRLYKALEDVYKALCDGKLSYSENVSLLLILVAHKLVECCFIIENETTELSDLLEMDVRPYLLYCDKAVAGEIFDPHHLLALSDLMTDNKNKPKKKRTAEVKKKEKPVQEVLKIQADQIAHIINLHEEMISRTYIIGNQVAILKNAIAENNLHAINEAYKLLSTDSQNLQNTLLIAHESLLSLMQDESFLKNHQECFGFFVTANEERYLIPSDYIFDVICESPKNYETKQNQKIVKYVVESENAEQEEEEIEEIPVYSLSSLFPGQKAKQVNILDTILIVNYQSQRIGIIVDSVQKFVSVIKKNMPPAFDNFPVLKGLAFDERYDMIPILHVPEIMKRFRSLRGYDVKKYEAITKKHINKILIVEDSETTRQIERTILLANNFIVEEAVDGIEAIEKMKKKQFDLILCDDDMPRMNGLILVDNIRRMENYEKVPVVAMSDKPIPQTDAFVSKSDFARDNLIQILKRMLNDE